MSDEGYWKKLERTADLKPTRLERRLARVAVKGHAANDVFANADLSGRSQSWVGMTVQALWTTIVTVSVFVGMLVALIPTLLWFGITTLPLLLLVSCLNQF